MRRLALAGPLLLALLLAGCVGIPTSGSVQTSAIDTDPEEILPIALPEGPQPGQSMAEILQGFLDAGRGPQNNYNVAREFLAPAATDWRGTDRVLIANVSSIDPVQVDEDTLEITVNVTAEVDAAGRYVAGSSTQTLTYDFTTVGGEVRIATAAPGTVLSASAFSTAFREYPLYFYDPSFRYLVPDLRWFPVGRTAADRIVTELLAGPSPWLATPVLASAIPTGTTGGAVYRAPRVDVDLSAEVRSESAVAQQRIRYQLEESLAALTNVTDVSVTSDGFALAAASDATTPEVRYLVGDVVGGVEGRFGTLGDEGVASISAIGSRVDRLEPQQVALGRDRASAAVLGADGVSLVPSTGEPVVVDARGGLLAPTIDPFGFVWSVPAGDPRGLQAAGSDLVVHGIPIEADGSVVAIELARDGTRLLVALRTPSGSRLLVFGVVRDADYAPLALGPPLALPVTGSIVDIAWMDETHVAVLRGIDGETAVDVVALGGPVVNLGSVDSGVAIVGGNLQGGLRVLGADGSVHRPGAGGWVDTGLVASFLGTQQ